jgi:hypothetical protein
MKRLLPFILLLTLLLSCTISFPGSDLTFDDKVATQSSIVMTATALHESLENKQDDPQATDTPADELDQQPSATPPADNPKKDLGQPSWRDDLSTGMNWSLDSTGVDYGSVRFYPQDGYLWATSKTSPTGIIWRLNYRKFKDAYLEAEFEIVNCSGDDQYGMAFRATDYDSGHAYNFCVTCDGRYSLLRGSTIGEIVILQDLKISDAIHSGANQINKLGVWVKGAVIRLYVNDQFLEEINDSGLQDKGHFGLFINAKQTPGFTIKMDEIAYWILN